MHKCSHRGQQEVKVGPYTILLGGTMHFEAGDADKADVLLPLTETGLEFGSSHQIVGSDDLPAQLLRRMPPLTAGKTYYVLAGTTPDFQPPPAGWGDLLRLQVIPLLAAGKRVMGFCAGSHGRTGTLLASLIAILEPEVEDPIAEARARHCSHAVETREQAEAVMALRGK